MNNDVKLYCGDCMEVMQHIPDGSIDMVLTDPPYSSGGLYAGERKMSTKDKYTSSKYAGAARFQSFSGDNMDQRNFTEFLRMVFAGARQKAVPEAVLATFVDWRNLPAMTDAVQAAGWIWRGIVVWDKGTARNVPGRYRPDCEYVVWATNGSKKVSWVPGQIALPGCYRVSSVASSKKHHQTEKPVALLEELLKISPAGATVFDLFMGSGSTGVSCIKTGRKFTGIELDEGYYKTAEQRIEDALTERALAYTE